MNTATSTNNNSANVMNPGRRSLRGLVDDFMKMLRWPASLLSNLTFKDESLCAKFYIACT
jgi:hypothetical protein